MKDLRTSRVAVLFTDDERTRIEKLADDRGQPLSVFLRSAALKEVAAADWAVT